MKLGRTGSLAASALFFFSAAASQAVARPAAAPPPPSETPPPPPPASPAPPPATGAILGDVGESCRARSDCAEGLKCIDRACHDENGGDDAPAPPPFEGLRGMVGAVLAGGPNLFFVDTGFVSGTSTSGGLLFALKGGVMIDRVEVGAEISPATMVLDFDLDPAFQVNAYAGYHIPLVDNFAWPIRGGLGMVALTSGGTPLFEARADLLGVSAVWGPVLVDLHAPSFRFLTEFDGVNAFSFMFGVGGAFLAG